MEWKKWPAILRRVLKFKGSPVAIRFSPEPRKGAAKGRFSACSAIMRARDGKIINLTKETSACPGGTTYLGLCPPMTGEKAKWLQEFLVYGEKFFCSYAAFHRATQYGTPPLTDLAENVVFCPLEKAKEAPDLVLFICNAEAACRLIHLAMYWDGVPPKALLTGSACQMAISYPINSGEINVSFMDWTARKMEKVAPDILIVSVPFEKMHGIMAAVPECSAGTAKAKLSLPPE